MEKHWSREGQKVPGCDREDGRSLQTAEPEKASLLNHLIHHKRYWPYASYQQPQIIDYNGELWSKWWKNKNSG